MEILRNKKSLLTLFLLSTVFGALFLALPTHAVSITKVLDRKVNNGTGNTGWHSQGATMSKDYYIWTDWKKSNGPTHIVFCKRSGDKSCWRSPKSYDYDHASTLYHRWGTDYFFVKAVDKVKGCWSIKNKKPVSMSYCQDSIKDIKIGKVITYTHSTAQGYTKYGDYYLRSYGNTPGGNYVTLFNKKFKVVKDVKLPNSINEVEDVMVDGDTGIVYFSSLQYVGGRKHVQFFKFPKNTFSQWLKPGMAGSGGGSSTDNGSSSNSSSLTGETGEKPQNYTPNAQPYNKNISSIFFGDFEDDGKGCGVYMIMNLIIELLAYGIGIAAIIGITISGIMYLTAKDNVAQTTKAKRRIYDIVVGVIAYATLYSILNFVLPGGNWSTSTVCGAPSSSSSSSNQSDSSGNGSGNGSSSNNNNNSNNNNSSESAKPEDGTSSAGRNLLTAAEYYATLIDSHGLKYCNTGGRNTWPIARDKGCLNCAEYVSIAAQKAGIMKAKKTIWIGDGKLHNKNNLVLSKVTIKTNVNKTIESLYKNKKLFPGDIVGSQTGVPHTMIFKEYKGGKYYFYSVNSKYNGTSAKTHTLKKSWVTKKVYKGSWKIGVIVHPK